jgi:hypothetical protein
MAKKSTATAPEIAPTYTNNVPSFPTDGEIAPAGARVVGSDDPRIETPEEGISDAPASRQNDTAVADDVTMTMLEIPVAPATKRNASRSLKDLSPGLARILRRVADGLAIDGAKLENGKTVGDSNGAIVWILQQLSK